MKHETDKLVVPFVYEDLFLVIKKLFLLIVKSNVLGKSMSTWYLNHINLEDKTVLMKIKDPNLGFAITFLITELKRKHMVKSTQLANFYNDVINIIICIIQKLSEKHPFGYVVKNAVIFDWNIMVSESSDILKAKLKLMLTYLLKF